tara:strand:- start:5767 stop:7782 length:2016 start_codon:yes stop_codon:yes gene_type:complete
MKINLEEAPFEVNLADKLDQDTLDRVGKELTEQIELDEESRKSWMDTNKDWLKLASQVREDKSFPWPGASNVKYPLLTIAAMQFHARALPNLVNSPQPVRARVIGRDPDGAKAARSQRISKYMSYQVLEEMEDWMDEMDRLLFILPMTGICYKKTYFSENAGSIKSIVVLPNDMIVNYYAQDFARARMTHVMYMDENEVYELQRAGVFLDIDLHEPDDEGMDRNAMNSINDIKPTSGSDMAAHTIYESHCLLDLDEDGYKEPYIVTLTKDGRILRIMARWSEGSAFYNTKGDLIKIVPDTYFTPYIFMPDPSSAVSGLGLGTLLGPINEAVNTMINQLIDAGTLSNLQGGFLGRGIKLRGGATRFRPGEWKIVNSTGDDIRKSVFPMPVRDPSNVLFQLLGQLIESGERVSATTDMMVGETPGQNTPATTAMASLEQGLKVFTGIYKRIHRALAKEYKIMYRLNSIYLDEDVYETVLDEQAMDPEAQFGKEDFLEEKMDIKPASDPNIVSQAQKSVKSQALLEKLQMGLPLNVYEVTKRALESEEQENIEQLMKMPEPQPNPEVEMQKAEFEMQQAEFQHKVKMDTTALQLDTLKIRAQAQKDESGSELNMAKVEQIGVDLDDEGRRVDMEEIKTEAEIIGQQLDSLDKEEDRELQQQQLRSREVPTSGNK